MSDADPIEVACDLPAIRRAIRRRYHRLRDDTLDELVGWATLELVERGRRHPGRRHRRSRLLDFAARASQIRERGKAKRPEIYPVDWSDTPLAVPSHVVLAERLADRLSEESSADQEAEWRALSVRERGERIAESRRLTATSPQ